MNQGLRWLSRLTFRAMAAALVVSCAVGATSVVAGGSALPDGPRPLTTKTPDIYGGKAADEAKSLWQVALVYRALPHVDGLFCGGTVISSRWVLTAAHCFFSPETCDRTVRLVHFYVAAGSVSLGDRVQLESAKEVVFAPDWDCKTRRGDVALVKLQRSIQLQQVKLADSSSSESMLKPGARALISGWGFTETGTRSRDLMEASIQIVEFKVCNDAYASALPQATVCGGDAGHDACTGDSGGPMFVRSANGVATQLGIVSFGKGCAQKGFPGVYTKVVEYADWIAGTTSCTTDEVAAGLC